MTTRPLVIRPEDLDSAGGPLVVKPEDLDGATLTQAAPKKGMLTRFREGLRSTMGFKPEGGLADDIAQIRDWADMSPRMPGEGKPEPSLKDLVTGAVGAQQDVAGKGIARMRQPGVMSKIEGGAQYLESGIPVVGPILSRAGEQAEQGDIAGMAGTMTPLAAGDENVVRGARGTLAEAVRAAPEVGGAVGGYAAGSSVGHPWAGGYLGRELGRRVQPGAERLADLIDIDRPAAASSSRIGGEWVPEPSQTGTTSEATEYLKGNPTPFGSKGVLQLPAGSEKGRGPLTAEQVPGKPNLKRLAERGDPRAGAELQRRGETVIYKSAEDDYPAPRESTTFSSRGGGGTRSPDEPAPVPRKGSSSKTPGPKPRLKDDIEAAGGESEQDRLVRLRTQPGESPASKSVKRQFKKRSKDD